MTADVQSPPMTGVQRRLFTMEEFVRLWETGILAEGERVEFLDGEPDRMTVAERDVLVARGLSGVRLSCQILCTQDMTVRAISRLAGSGRKDAGHPPAEEITPSPQWMSK